VNADRLNELRARLLRLQRRLAVKEGIGSTWSAKTSDGATHRYIINGVKSFDELTDEIETMFVWVWSFKDHLKAHARSLGKSDRWIEAEASADVGLSVCADIANRLKHGELRDSRSMKSPELGKLTYSVPQEAMGKLTVRAFEVELDVSNADLVSFEMPVLDNQGRVIGDAFKLLEKGTTRWEELLRGLESAV
jgi:hypothetical protein